MDAPRLRDFIVWTVWGLLEAQTERISLLLRNLAAELATAAARAAAPGPPFPGVPGAGQSLLQRARGAVSQGDPLMAAAGYPDQVSLLAPTEAGVTAFIGFAASDAPDGADVEVWYSGPAPLFSSLNVAPLDPDMAEYFVYGPHPPVLYSAIPANTWYRRCGTPLNSTTLLLSRGDTPEKTPPP